MQKILRHLTAFLFILFLSLSAVPQAHALSSDEWGIHCVNLNNAYVTAGNATGASDVPTIRGVECLVAQVLAYAVTLIGLVAFVMFLVGGFQYLTAGTNSKGVEAGKNAITFAIIGIVLALSSIIILNLIATITGVETIKTFRILQLK
jgi:hypothetical protein